MFDSFLYRRHLPHRLYFLRTQISFTAVSVELQATPSHRRRPSSCHGEWGREDISSILFWNLPQRYASGFLLTSQSFPNSNSRYREFPWRSMIAGQNRLNFPSRILYIARYLCRVWRTLTPLDRGSRQFQHRVRPPIGWAAFASRTRKLIRVPPVHWSSLVRVLGCSEVEPSVTIDTVGMLCSFTRLLRQTAAARSAQPLMVGAQTPQSYRNVWSMLEHSLQSGESAPLRTSR